jgi:hypothetical protein
MRRGLPGSLGLLPLLRVPLTIYLLLEVSPNYIYAMQEFEFSLYNRIFDSPDILEHLPCVRHCAGVLGDARNLSSRIVVSIVV